MVSRNIVDNINLDLINPNLDLSVLESLSPAEKELAFSILKEYSETGNSKKLNTLLLEDYAETPVDILTFVDDYNYLGNAWHDAEGKTKLYPYWRKELVKIFPDNLTTTVNNGIFSGSRGRGKAQPLDALLYSESGYIKMRDVLVGTKLYGSDGKLHKVLGIFPQGKKPVYKISFSDGTSTLCSDEHLWTVIDEKDHVETISLNILIKLLHNETLRIPLLQKPIIDIYHAITSIKNKELSEDDLLFTIQALGGTYNIKTKEICLPKSIAKAANIRYKEPVRYITSIEYIEDQECQCIYIDAEDHLYLTNDLILTHNTEIAVLIAAYLLHRILCLKDPVAFFHLKPTEKLVFAFMNIKLALAEEIGVTKFQNTIQSSPWFMQNGTLEGRTKKIWIPKKFKDQEAIDIKIGSQSDDLIGLPIYYCLDGDTLIKTSDGIKKIKELENQSIQVYSIDENKEEVLSDVCTVKQTATSNIEYQIELEDGSIIKCTPNHRFMLKDGSYKEAQYLTEEDELFESNTMYGYIYLTENLITGKKYIGKHKAKDFEFKKYQGSGKSLHKAFDKYGKDNFKTSLLPAIDIPTICYSEEELDKAEKYYIAYYNCIKSPDYYNLSEGGRGGNSYNHLSDEAKNQRNSKISKTLLNTFKNVSADYYINRAETKRKTLSKLSEQEKLRRYNTSSEAQKRYQASLTAEERAARSEKHRQIARNRTKEQKAEQKRKERITKAQRTDVQKAITSKKLSEACLGKKYYTDGNNILKCYPGQEPKGYYLGGANIDKYKFIYIYNNVSYKGFSSLLTQLRIDYPQYKNLSQANLESITKGTTQAKRKFPALIDCIKKISRTDYEN